MRRLNTIQKRENLNNIYAVDDKTNRANHHYVIEKVLPAVKIGEIQFQKGPRNSEDSIHGIIDTDLLEIVRDRLTAFQSGPFSCRENALALTHVEEALMWMNRRVEDRIERQVLGQNKK